MEYDVFGIRWIEFHLSFIYGKSLNATWMIKDTEESTEPNKMNVLICYLLYLANTDK